MSASPQMKPGDDANVLAMLYELSTKLADMSRRVDLYDKEARTLISALVGQATTAITARLDDLNGKVAQHSQWISDEVQRQTLAAEYERGKAEGRGQAITFSKTALSIIAGVAGLISAVVGAIFAIVT